MDVEVDHVGIDVRFRTPHRVEDLLAGEDLTGVADQVTEEREFARGEVDRPVADLGDVTELVEAEIAGLHPGTRGGRTTTAEGPDPSDELVEREWLGQVVVGSRVEPDHAVVDRPECGEHEDRCHRRLSRAGGAAG